MPTVEECYETLLEEGIKSKVILELGVGSVGNSTHFLLAVCKENGAHLWSVDKDQCNTVVSKFSKRKHWTFTQMDDLEYGKTWHRTIDLLFIDTSHERDQTFKELELYSKFIINGTIVLHDTMAYEGCILGVYDFLNAHKGEWEFTEVGYISGCGILKRRN